MTTQHLFDLVSTHLLTQNNQSVDKLGQCAYRGRNNTKCAIGILISDKDYDHTMEGCSVSAASVKFAAGIDSQNEKVAMKLQNIHDYLEPLYWRNALKELATREHLNLPSIFIGDDACISY